MKSHVISEVQYLDRTPTEIHYLKVNETETGYSFTAGEVIGQGFGAGGGEGMFDIESLQAMTRYKQFLIDIDCLWLDDILKNSNISDQEKYFEIIKHANN